MIDLFEEYPDTDEGIDLYDEYNENNRPGTPAEALKLSKQQISAKYPNLPNFVRDALLSITPRQQSPMLDSAARGITDVTNYIPSVFGGLLQGASIPIRGVSGLIPTEFTQRLANSPDLTSLFSRPETEGQEAAQLAGEFAGGGGMFGKLLGGAKGIAKLARLPGSLQTPAALAATGFAGTPGETIDRTLGSAGALALGGLGSAAKGVSEKVPAFMRGLFTESTPEALVQSIQRPHDILESNADKFYRQVKNAVKNRNITTPMKKEYLGFFEGRYVYQHTPASRYLKQAKEYFPQRTTSTKDLFKRAELGDYDAIHDIQSSLYKKGTKQLSGDDLVKENEGEDILDLRNNINDHLQNEWIKQGHTDIAHALSQGKKHYSDLMNTYYAPNLRKSIGKMVNRDTRLVPKNPEKIFEEDSVPIRRFLQAHPDAAKHALGVTEKKDALKMLNKLFYAGGVSVGGIAGAKVLYDLSK